MKQRIIISIFSWLAAWTLTAQPLCRVVAYDEEDGVPSGHITQLLQDDKGFMWFATWNGLCRYDGYEFRTFKPQVGDGCHIATDRFRNIVMLDAHQMLCQVDESYCIFDLQNYTFRDLTNEEQQQIETLAKTRRQTRSLQRKPYSWTDSHQTRWTLSGDGRLTWLDNATGHEVEQPLPITFNTLTFAMADARGDLWALDYQRIYKICTDNHHTKRLNIEPKAEVKCLFADQEGRYWVATKGDKTVRVFNKSNDQLLGYMDRNGQLHQSYTSLGVAVYSMYQSKDGTLWFGTKPDGLFRLSGQSLSPMNKLPFSDIYHIAEDRFGRLWVATLDGGVWFTDEPKAEQPVFKSPRHYPKEQCPRARYLFIGKDDVMMIATSQGLLTTRLLPNADEMRFTLHQREADRKESLSCSATMDVVQDRQGRYFVGTESGGVNMIAGNDPLASSLAFRHIREHFHLQPNDIVQSLTVKDDGGLIAVGSHLITLMDSTQHGRVMDASEFQEKYRFSEAHPLSLGNGRWLFGLLDGAIIMSESQMQRQIYKPKLVLTNLEVRGEQSEVRDWWGIENMDTLTLQPHERNATIHFAAIDYQSAERINYAFRLSETGSDTTAWNYIGRNRSATLLDLKPGEYLLQIRCTNADGEWLDQMRQLTIIVEPTFWESTLGQILIVLIIMGILAAIVYTLLYIRNIKRKQHETLEAYLSLLQQHTSNSTEPIANIQAPKTEDPLLQRVMQFVEENISNSEAGVGDMASAAAVSRSGLQRKLKQAMGITPQDLLKEARIKRACQLLRQTDKNVAEVAYACGFSDPKYFSRSFKQSTGKSPTEYRDGVEE